MGVVGGKGENDRKERGRGEGRRGKREHRGREGGREGGIRVEKNEPEKGDYVTRCRQMRRGNKD